MREIIVTRHGSPDVLEERDRQTPEPGPGEIRIRVKASGVNFIDVLARMGLDPDAPAPPMVPGCEVSGFVDAIGPGPARHEVGRHVMALTRGGGYADTVIVPADYVWNAPSNLSHNEAASIPVSFLTALVALYRMANLKSGESVLIRRAGGGVGVAAMQLSRLRRATVIGTASAAKHNALRSLGIDFVLDGQAADLEANVARLTGGRGVDVVLDPLGGDSLMSNYRMLAPLGRLICFGSQDAPPLISPADLMHDNKGLFGLTLAHLWSERRFLSGAMEALLTDFAGGRLKAVVARTFPLARAADAHQYLQDRGNVGNVVLTA